MILEDGVQVQASQPLFLHEHQLQLYLGSFHEPRDSSNEMIFMLPNLEGTMPQLPLLSHAAINLRFQMPDFVSVLFILFLCVRCMRVTDFAPACRPRHTCGGQRITLSVGPCLPPCLGQGFLTSTAVYTSLAGLQTSGILPFLSRSIGISDRC